ncbi:MAG TPA: glycosyltransferase, partial [Kineosporiaceae bacterium]|nr:glycosyltransferase [Kineosporiaceae bacterium]
MTNAVVPRRAAMLSVHTSPLEQPGTGDAGGLNVYVVETAKRLARAGTEVEIFTRSTSSDLPPIVELAPGVLVRHIVAGPFEGLSKNDLPGQLCAFAAGLMQIEARQEPGWYDLVHSHYWLSGQVGWLAADRWNVPLVHTMHTMAKVKNESVAEGDCPEPPGRVIGEEQVVATADRLLASTTDEARQLIELYGASPRRVAVVGGPSGTGLERPEELQRLTRELDLDGVVRFRPPAARAVLADWYRAADLVVVPSYSESFGLVAVEAQACGTPVVAARVGGLVTAVRD